MRYFFIVVLLSLSSLSQAFISNQHDFLPVEEAFRFELMDDVEPAILVWQIAPEHYLYRDKLGITDAQGNSVPIVYPQGIEHSDEFFGDTQVYRQLLQLPLDSTLAQPLQVTWQGCADAGLCYPPQTTSVGSGTATDEGTATVSTSQALAEDQSIAER
jgi:thiol:disulfide interchange protein DsbD